MNKAVEVVTKLLADRLINRPTKFIGKAKQANPVYNLHKLDELLKDFECLSQQDNFQEACEALARGCGWRDYDGKKWSK